MSKNSKPDMDALHEWRAQLKVYAQTPSQAIFLIGSAISGIMLIPLLQQSRYLAENAYLNDINYLWPRISDLYISLIGYLILNRLRQAFTLKMKPWMEVYISPKYKGVERSDKALKSATYAFKLGYYILAIVGGYLALADQEFAPWTLFGKGDSIEVFKNYPYVEIPDKVKYYYFFTLTYHLDSFFGHAVSKPKKDYGEMFFHHVVTLILVIFSYSCNFMGGGSLVLFVHDFAQIFVALCRVFVDMKLPTAYTLTPFVCLIITWAITRCVILPWSVLYLGVYSSAEKYNVPRPIGVLQCLMSMIVLMHYYWLILFLKMGWTFIHKKKVVDMVADGVEQKKN